MPRFPSPNPLILKKHLGDYADSLEIFPYETVDSTNNAAKADAQTASRPALYVARGQTAGRGRLGRSFHSPADTGLYMTVAYTTDRPLSDAVRVTAEAAVATAAAIEALTDKHPAIKWVNDIYLAGCKIGGILTEAVSRTDGSTRMIVGLGINLTTTVFPDGLRAPASCLFPPQESSLATPELADTLAGEITRRLLDTVLGRTDPSQSLAFYRRHLLYVGERVLCTRGHEVFAGVITGVSEDYALLVRVDGEIRRLSSGEISIRPQNPS